jgi:hypothetical protein
MDETERSRLKLDVLHLAREHSRSRNADCEAPLGEIIKTAEVFYKFVTE